MQLTQEYTIGMATPAHVPSLAAIEIAAASIFPPGSIPDHIRSDSVPESALFEAVQEGLLWVALAKDGRPVGYALVQLLEDGALLWHAAEHMKLREKADLYLTTFKHIPWNAPFYAKRGFTALSNGEVPPFLKKILKEEKCYGLTGRIAMRLAIH